MKRKRKTYYCISVTGMWWCGNKYGWTKDPFENDSEICCSSRTMSRARSAIKHISTLPAGSELVQFGKRRGKRTMKEYIKVK